MAAFACGPAASGRSNWVMTRSDGVAKLGDDTMLDPGHPDAAAWVVSMATSIVRNYEVDGINLDRIRYPDGNLGTNVPSWGYNPTAVARFRAETGRSDTPANTDPQWTQQGWVQVPIWEMGIEPRERYVVEDLLDGARYTWRGEWNFVKLDPTERAAHILVVRE